MWIEVVFIGSKGERIAGAITDDQLTVFLNGGYINGELFDVNIGEEDIEKFQEMEVVNIFVKLEEFSEGALLPSPNKGGSWQNN